MIEAIDSRQSKVRAVCTDCGCAKILSCDYERRDGKGFVPNAGQARRKLTQTGWLTVGQKLFCPACHNTRKLAKERAVLTKVTPLREPTREQKRDIMQMLDVAYDVATGRYKGADTDVTVATAMADGIMPGWVADLRETFFGPAGENDEMKRLADELVAWMTQQQKSVADLTALVATGTKILREANEGRGRAEVFLQRLEAVKKAVGPKAASA